MGLAVREYPTDAGPVDYVLFVDRDPVGVVEAKKEEEGPHLSVHETQVEYYARSKLKWFADSRPLPFVYESTGILTRYTDLQHRVKPVYSTRFTTSSLLALVLSNRRRNPHSPNR